MKITSRQHAFKNVNLLTTRSLVSKRHCTKSRQTNRTAGNITRSWTARGKRYVGKNTENI